MENLSVTTKATVDEVHHFPMLQVPIPVPPMRDVVKTIGLGLAIAVGQFALLILLIGSAVHR